MDNQKKQKTKTGTKKTEGRKGGRRKNAARRNVKDSLFCSLFSEKKRALSLYNAINGTAYDNPEELEVVTLDDVVYLHQKNDVSILFDSRLTLWEHQSTFNPNMPIRGLLYYAQNMEDLLGDSRRLLYRRTLVKIPEPAYYVLYNGEEEQPERLELKLSDAFLRPTRGYEWTAHMLNIKAGKNAELLERCPELKGYAVLIQYIRDYRSQGLSRNEAVDLAVKRCIEEGYLTEYLQKQRREARRMLLTEFDEEAWKWAVREDGREEGREAERASLIRNMLSNGKSPEDISSFTGIPLEEVKQVEKTMLVTS